MHMHIESAMSTAPNLIDFIHRPKYISNMKRLQAFKFELRVSGSQLKALYRFAGSCRFVYNKALALQKERYEKGEKKLSYAGLCKYLTEWRRQDETKWLGEIHSQVLQQSLKDLERAYQNFFMKRADFPQFKCRGVRDGFRYPQGCQLDEPNNRIYLPKLGWVRYRNSRPVLGKISNVTISRNADKWYVSLQTEREVPEPIHPSSKAIGIDMGITRLATLSDGYIFEAVNSFASQQYRLSLLQRRVSKKKKFSQNWKKAVGKVSVLHRKIRNIRQDYLHKTSSAISKNHAMVCIEDLQVKNMSKSARGSMTKPGRQVKAKAGLNKAILDQGWYEFRRQLEYKQTWLGGCVIAVPPQNTSRRCPDCDYVSAENRKVQAHFECVKCGYADNADKVGAMNILRAGHARLACGEKVQLGHSMNQEPTEAIQALRV
jgi:putative transposase